MFFRKLIGLFIHSNFLGKYTHMYRSRGWVWTAEGFIMFSYSPLIATNNLVLCLARVGRRSPLRQTFAVRASRRTINLNPCLGSLSPEGWPSRGRKGGGRPRAKWGRRRWHASGTRSLFPGAGNWNLGRVAGRPYKTRGGQHGWSRCVKS